MKTIFKKILCRLGIHRWRGTDAPWEHRCDHCGKITTIY